LSRVAPRRGKKGYFWGATALLTIRYYDGERIISSARDRKGVFQGPNAGGRVCKHGRSEWEGDLLGIWLDTNRCFTRKEKEKEQWVIGGLDMAVTTLPVLKGGGHLSKAAEFETKHLC